MLYLEDYMEMIENLPMEMRDRFTDMREMDLQVQNTMDSTDEQMKNFFKKCATTPSLKKEWRDEQFARIKAEYSKALDDSDEKVQLATTIYDLLERYLRKLDQELAKFKMELEADSAGITEILEKRSLELDRPPTNHNNHRAEKRKYSSMMGSGGGVHGNAEKRHHNHTPTLEPSHKELAATYSGISSLATREPMALSRGSSSAAPSPGMPMFSSAQVVSSSPAASSTTPALSYSLGHVGAGSNAAIAAAASRAIGATLEMQQGRRTASLKASYEAAQRGQSAFASFPQQSSSSSASSSQQQATASSFSAADIPPPPPTTKVARQKKSRAQQQAARQAAAAAAAAAAAQQAAQAAAPSLEQSALGAALQASTPTAESLDVGGTTSAAGTGDESVSSQWPYDPNEPRYCVCNDVSYGDMVGCDNNDCTIEWFHYGCVGLAQAPKGKWYCPNCVSAMKRRGRK